MAQHKCYGTGVGGVGSRQAHRRHSFAIFYFFLPDCSGYVFSLYISTFQKYLRVAVQMKHPLQNEWVFWHFKDNSNAIWEEQWRIVQTVRTVEDFWGVYNWIVSPSDLPIGSGQDVAIWSKKFSQANFCFFTVFT